MQPTLTKPVSSQMLGYCGLGGVGLEGVEVLMGLGLTGRQARVYLSLLKAGNTKVQTIAGPSLVHRQEIYRILDSLMQIGLVQRNLSAPKTYTPTPIKEATQMLLQQKTNQLNNICNQAKQLSEKLSQNGASLTSIDLKPCFGTVVESDRGGKYHKTIKNSQSTIEAVTSWKRFKQLSTHFETQLRTNLKHSVTIHIVTEKPPDLHMPKWINTASSNYPNFRVKTTPDPPATGVTIFDHTQAAIDYNPNVSLTKGPELWTTNPAIIVLCQTYFNTVWA